MSRKTKTFAISFILLFILSLVPPIVHGFDTDNNPPIVNITKPTHGLFIFNQKIANLSNLILIIGPIDIVAEASDDESGIDYVEYSIIRYPIFILGRFMDENYTYTLDRFSLGGWHVTITAYDKAGNSADDYIVIWKFL